MARRVLRMYATVSRYAFVLPSLSRNFAIFSPLIQARRVGVSAGASASGVRLMLMAIIVAFHAHPDDEVLLTGGTIARLAAEGHRVIIVVACDGDVLPGPDQGRRLDELRASAAILG